MSEVYGRLEDEFHQRPVPPEARGPSQPPRPTPRRIEFTLARARPRATYVLLALNVVMFAVSYALAQRIGTVVIDGQAVDGFTVALLRLGAKDNSLIDAGQWWRLLTPVVLHGSILHLLFNSYALFVLGPQVEATYGTGRFLAIYVLSGLAGSISSYTFNPLAWSVGASGAIFGLFGALAAFAWRARSLIGWEASRMQLYQMATLVAINLALGFVTPNIDNSAHLGGLLMGALSGLALAPRYQIDTHTYPPSLGRLDRPVPAWSLAIGLLLLALALFLVAQRAALTR